MIDCQMTAFNPARFQWFNDEFLDPMELKAVYKGESLTLYSGVLLY